MMFEEGLLRLREIVWQGAEEWRPVTTISVSEARAGYSIARVVGDVKPGPAATRGTNAQTRGAIRATGLGR
jgi:hypothetical protein